MTTIGSKPLETPVFLRLKHLPYQCEVVDLHDFDEQDRQVARDAVRPQPRLTLAIAGEHVW